MIVRIVWGCLIRLQDNLLAIVGIGAWEIDNLAIKVHTRCGLSLLQGIVNVFFYRFLRQVGEVARHHPELVILAEIIVGIVVIAHGHIFWIVGFDIAFPQPHDARLAGSATVTTGVSRIIVIIAAGHESQRT